MADDVTLTDLCKERAETGKYGSARFVMNQLTIDQMIAKYAKPVTVPSWEWSVNDIVGIPMVVDDSLPDGTWRLVDSVTHEVLYEGTGIA